MRLATSLNGHGLSRWKTHMLHACPLDPAREMTMSCPCAAYPERALKPCAPSPVSVSDPHLLLPMLTAEPPREGSLEDEAPDGACALCSSDTRCLLALP